MNLLQSITRLLVATAITVPSIVACSGGDSEDDAPKGTGGSAGTSNVVVTGGDNGVGNVGNGGGATVIVNGEECTIDDDGCVGQAYEGESIPLDIYIMFDQSGSMSVCPSGDPLESCPGERRLDLVREAADLFMADDQSAGIGVGIGYFGKQTIGAASCDQADYEAADVEIGLLPDHHDAIMASLNDKEPTGETPSGAAIRGACTYAQAYKSDNPGHEVIILLLTDGIPEAPVSCVCEPDTVPSCMPSDPRCCPTIEDAVDAATACREGDPGVRTYVLGVGPALGNLQQIAEAGGTGDAYLVEGGDVVNEVLNALRAIRGDAIPCTMALPTPPDGSDLILTQVNITYASPSCEPTYFSYTETLDLCGDEGGWYFDDTNENIQLCPTSCDQVSAPGGKLVFTVGCARRDIPR